jgi:hypothetical protein
VRYRRNVANIGGGANFLRAIEGVEADYVWLRGDDDPITRAQVKAARSHFSPSLPLIILSPSETAPFYGRGIYEFAEHFAKVRSMGWLSSLILPSAIAKDALPWGYWGVHTGWAHVCLVLGLFRVRPDLEFVVSPFSMEAGDFREVGREASGQWAFFTSCIRKFPSTAGAIKDRTVRDLYLARWRRTQKFSLVKTMARQQAGLGGKEMLSLGTFAPLFSPAQPKAFALGLSLWGMTCVPQSIWRVGLAAWSLRQSPRTLADLGLEWLSGEAGFAQRLSAIRSHASNETVEGFL